jgi:transglutaminase-like putative cysteine protease
VKTQNDELRIDHGTTIHYSVWSELDAPSPTELRRARPFVLARAVSLGVYLQLPAEITPRTRALAHQITDGIAGEYDRAAAIQQWLDDNLGYTLDLPDPGRDEPLDYFLFESHRGHCEYFASAFAILAREAGIPVRQVNGFLGGEWNEYQGYVAVRAGDAHSWDEVYFPGRGWVTFDPTPPSRHDPLGRGDTGWRAKLGRFLDTLKFQWTKWVIEYDLVAQLSLFRDLGSALKHGATELRDVLVRVVRVWPLLVGIGGIVLAVVLFQRRRALALAPTSGGPPRGRTSIGRVYDAVGRRLAKAGFARPPAQTPRELVARVPQAIADDVRELTELYYSAEWGGNIDPATERRAAELAAAIRAALDRPATA